MAIDTKVVHIKVPKEIYEGLQRISVREARAIHQVARLALAEIATRGFTDTLNGKEEAEKRKRK